MTTEVQPLGQPWYVHRLPHLWPLSAGKVFLAEAARQIGRAMFVDWTDDKLSSADPAAPLFIPGPKTILQDESYALRSYVLPVAALILNMAQTGELMTFARPFNGGASVPIEAADWEIDTAVPRLSRCAIALDRPFDPDVPPTHWIFVSTSDLGRIVGEIEFGSLMPESQPAPSQKVLVGEASKASAIRACAAWLVEQFDDPATERMKKVQFQDDALQMWAGSLKIRGFLDAWNDAVALRPERAKPGRRT